MLNAKRNVPCLCVPLCACVQSELQRHRQRHGSAMQLSGQSEMRSPLRTEVSGREDAGARNKDESTTGNPRGHDAGHRCSRFIRSTGISALAVPWARSLEKFRGHRTRPLISSGHLSFVTDGVDAHQRYTRHGFVRVTLWRAVRTPLHAMCATPELPRFGWPVLVRPSAPPNTWRAGGT